MSVSPSDLQNCLKIIEKPVFYSPSACILFTIPASLSTSISNALFSVEILGIHRIREEGKKLEHNEVEKEEIHLFTSKEMLKERYRSEEEVKVIKQAIVECCGEKIAAKAIQEYEKRTAYLIVWFFIDRNQRIEENYKCVNVSIKTGCIGF